MEKYFINGSLQSKDEYFKFLFETEKFSDIVLIIKDKSQAITLNLHKMMISLIPQLEMLIRNSLDNTITIHVPDINMTQKIIALCYNIPMELKDNQKMGYLRCCNFMGIEADCQILDDVEIENYDDLVSLASEYNFCDHMVELLIKKMPDDYDLKKLSEDLLLLMREKSLISPLDVFVCINRVYTGLRLGKAKNNQLSDKIPLFGHIRSLVYSSMDNNFFCAIYSPSGLTMTSTYNSFLKLSQDNKYSLTYHGDKIYVSCVHTRKCIKWVDIYSGPLVDWTSLNNQLIIMTESILSPYCLRIIDLDDNDHDITIPINITNPTKLFLLPGKRALIVAVRNINIYPFHGDRVILSKCPCDDDTCPLKNYEGNIILSNNYQYLVIRYQSHLEIFDLNNYQSFRKEITINDHLLFYFSKDDRHIVFYNRQGYSYVKFEWNNISDIMTDNVPEKRYEDLTSIVTDRIDDALKNYHKS